MRYPNQMRITIDKSREKNCERYLKVEDGGLYQAAGNLQAGAFKLYIYLAHNKDKFNLDLSQIAVERDFGIKKNQYYKAVEELKEKGYLIQPDKTVNN